MSGSVIVRPSALTEPVVREPTNPYGFPTATTGSPTLKEDELTIVRGLNSDEGAPLTETTAKSEYGSVPSTVAE